MDDEKVAYEATRHLISLGHTDIALVTGPMEEDCSLDRTEGYRRALQEAGIPFDDSKIIEGDWSATSGQDALLSFVEQGRVPTAVFAQNDRMAMGVLRAARDVNIKVPTQLAVIGVDDMPLSSYFDPPLTTMRQDMPRIGRETIIGKYIPCIVGDTVIGDQSFCQFFGQRLGRDHETIHR